MYLKAYPTTNRSAALGLWRVGYIVEVFEEWSRQIIRCSQ